jgi:lysyl-tRNA synthetase, class II
MAKKSATEERVVTRQRLIDGGKIPYPQDGHKTHTNAEALEQEHDVQVTVAGRIRSMRGHGKIRFIDLEDESGRLQVVIKSNEVSNFDEVNDISVGDFLRVTGERFVTKAGEESIKVQQFDILAKALRSLPDGWGENKLKDEEIRYRNRSVDLTLFPDRREVFRKRARIITSIRESLVDFGYMEVETPTLQPLYGGANARPFTTHINVWDMPMYLRISPELYLKYLIMGGFDKVFEITKNFRNEGVDRTHNPEFTMMECYMAYGDYNDMMDLTEIIYENAARAANGSPIVKYKNVEIDFSQPWRRLPMKEAIKEFLDIDVDRLSDSKLKSAIKAKGLKYEGQWIRGLGIATLFEAVEKFLIQPTFITDFPRETTTLCKPHRDDGTLIERFEPYVMGWEVGNAYTELNDPVLQRQFWEEEREEDDEAHPLDEGFIEAMEYGMPPTGGLGLGVDRMVMLLTNQTKIRDVILFPTMKPV